MHTVEHPGGDPEAEPKTILGVDYLHLRSSNQDDLYVTQDGRPFLEHLRPERLFLDKQWLRENSVRLRGSSTCYRIRTKRLDGVQKDIVLKWNRMGQNILLPREQGHGPDAEFNSPFEEFMLLTELRNSRRESPGAIHTHRPLAIFVPRERKDLDRLGRTEQKMLRILERHKDLDLDMFRSYAVVYEWIKGIDAVEAAEQGLLDDRGMAELTLEAERKVKAKGFEVLDRKPHHLIVRPRPDGSLARDREGAVLYALVDFELLKRTPEREQVMRDARRRTYFQKKLLRFEPVAERLPPHLNPVRILGVDYVHGHVPSTAGKLWVVGTQPGLFDYFLPERWEFTPRVKLRRSNEVYYTTTKDSIHVVWRVSNVGSRPDMDPFDPEEQRVLHFGFNSPFEEISLALYLRGRGISTISPLAVYMAGDKTEMADFLLDESRYQQFKDLHNPDGTPVLRPDRAYITLWGDWNRPDYEAGERDGCFHQRISALHAYRKGRIGKEEYFQLEALVRQRLRHVGVEDLFLRGGHFLVALDAAGRMIRNEQGLPEIRICDFELLRRT